MPPVWVCLGFQFDVTLFAVGHSHGVEFSWQTLVVWRSRVSFRHPPILKTHSFGSSHLILTVALQCLYYSCSILARNYKNRAFSFLCQGSQEATKLFHFIRSSCDVFLLNGCFCCEVFLSTSQEISSDILFFKSGTKPELNELVLLRLLCPQQNAYMHWFRVCPSIFHTFYIIVSRWLPSTGCVISCFCDRVPMV